MGESISALSAVALIYICLCQYYTVLITVVSLRIKGSVSLPTLFFKVGYSMSFAFPCKCYYHPVDCCQTKKNPCYGFTWSGVEFLDQFREN